MSTHFRQLRIFVLPSEPQANWLENVVGRVIKPAILGSNTEWFWFSRYGDSRAGSSEDTDLTQIPPEFNHAPETQGFWRSVRFRIAVQDEHLTQLENLTIHLIRENNYAAASFLPYDWINDLAADRFLASPRTAIRKERRASLVVNFLSASSRIYMDALLEANSDGQFHHEENHSYYWGQGSSFEPLRHLFVNLTGAPTQIVVSGNSLAPHPAGEPQLIFDDAQKQFVGSINWNKPLTARPSIPPTLEELRRTGQVESIENLERLVFEFEQILRSFGVDIRNGSELEKVCLSVIDILSKSRVENIRVHREDIREMYTEVLGMWLFLQKIVRHRSHPSFAQFVPHLRLLNDGVVIQNMRSKVTDEAANKIFELLFALVLLDVSDDVILDPPHGAVGDNPDILALIDGRRWGFACKTLHAPSGRTFFGNLQKGVQQIESSPAEIGCVVVNVRNLLDPEIFWPILNKDEYLAGANPVFAACADVGQFAGPKIADFVLQKRDQIVDEIANVPGLESNPIEDLFAGKKALPMFFAFFQTVSGTATDEGPVPSSVITLSVGTFGDVSAYQSLFERINEALHERSPSRAFDPASGG